MEKDFFEYKGYKFSRQEIDKLRLQQRTKKLKKGEIIFNFNVKDKSIEIEEMDLSDEDKKDMLTSYIDRVFRQRLSDMGMYSEKSFEIKNAWNENEYDVYFIVVKKRY